MALYENVFVVRQDVSAQQVEELTARFTDMITEAGGRVAKTEYWGLRTLAYKIKKNRKATMSCSTSMRRRRRCRKSSATWASART